MHIPVLLKEAIDYLDIRPAGKYIDATYGAGGHSRAIEKRGGRVLGIDWDFSVIARSEMSSWSPPAGEAGGAIGSDSIVPPAQGGSGLQNDRIKMVHGNFADLKEIAAENDFTEADGVLFDLGLRSEQLDDPARGFSFQKDGPLDMRFDLSSWSPPAGEAGEARGSQKILSPLRGSRMTKITAADIVNQYPERELVKIFYDFGEERRFGKRVARAILDVRKACPVRNRTAQISFEQNDAENISNGVNIETTARLFDIIKAALPRNLRFRAGDTARRIFQALRIAVNHELENLQAALPQAVEILRPGGRLAVISFHSLEDRIVKEFFAAEARTCVCPPEFPECRCNHRPRLKILTRKPVTAGEEEAAANSRSQSAKLRVAEKLR